MDYIELFCFILTTMRGILGNSGGIKDLLGFRNAI